MTMPSWALKKMIGKMPLKNNPMVCKNQTDFGDLTFVINGFEYTLPNDDWVKNKKLLTTDQDIQKIKTKLQSKGSFEYSFSHFDLETEIFYGNVKKAKLSKSNWIKKSSYSSSRMPTVMKKIVDIAV